jgi:outer membrane lipoprotein SlyB
MKVTAMVLGIIFAMGVGDPSYAQNACRQCIRDKLETAKVKTLAAVAIGALGGAKVGNLPGAACGAVLGAVAGGVDALIELGQCDKICGDEATAMKDKDKGQCDELMKKVKR